MITLEITSTDIKLMEVINGKVTRWASGPIEAGTFQEEVVVKPQVLGAAVKQLMSSSGMKEKKVIASVSSLYSLSRIVVVPGQQEQAITEESIIAAAEEVMPLSAEEMYLSWHAIAPVTGGQQVLVVGVPRDVIDSEVRALRAAGLIPNVLGLRTLALARAVNRKNAIMLNIDASSYDVVVVVDGIAEVLRTTAWQPEDLSAEDRAELLASSLELTVSFYNSHHPGSQFDPATPLFITGNFSGERDLIEQLRDQVSFTIEPLAPSLEYPEYLPISEFAVNIGMALQASASPMIRLRFTRKSKETPESAGTMGSMIPDINILPQIYRGWRPSTKQIYASLAFLAALALFFPINSATADAMKETAATKQKFNTVNIMMQKRLAELSKREPLQNAITQYDSIASTSGGLVDDLAAIRNLAQKLNINIPSISQTAGSVTFTCQAPDYIVFRDFINALEDNGRFTTPIIPPEGYPYIKGGTITLKPKNGK